MEFLPVAAVSYDLFHELLTQYYRDGADADTPQEQIDSFILYLHRLCSEGAINGAIALQNEPIGFVLWCVDSADLPFSNRPGWGTILEIGVWHGHRGCGYGRQMAAFAESSMEVPEYYVCAYGPAEAFWKKCGYRDSGSLAENGLKLMVKDDCSGR